MKITLVSAPRVAPRVADFPPLGLGYLGAVARNAGHEVTILDASAWPWQTLRDRIRDSAPDVLGVTCWTIERGQAWEVLRVAREVCPKARLVAGGPHASAFPEHVFAKTPADFVVIGEGEHTFKELLDAIEHGSDPASVNGLAFQQNSSVIRTPPRTFENNLDSLPRPLHEQFDYGKYSGLRDTSRRAAAVITSRGCPFQCIYCSSSAYWGRRLRKRSVADVMAEVEYLYFEKGVRAILFFDDNLLVDGKRCVELSKALCDRNLDLVWAAEGSVRVELKTLQWMKKAGCYRIDFGVESGSPQILKNIGKSFTVEDTRRAFALCREAGIKPNAYLIVGSPGETRQTVNDTLVLMRELQPGEPLSVRPGLWVLPETELYRMSLEKGVINEADWLRSDDAFWYTGDHSKQGLQELADHFNRWSAWDERLSRNFVSGFKKWRSRGFRLLTEPRSLLASAFRKWSERRSV